MSNYRANKNRLYRNGQLLGIILMTVLFQAFEEIYASEYCQKLAQNKLTIKRSNSQHFQAKLLISNKSPIDCEDYNSDTGEYTCEGIKIIGDQITTKDGEALRYGLTNYKQDKECSDTNKGLLIKTTRSWEGKIFETEYYLKFRSVIFNNYIIDNPIF